MPSYRRLVLTEKNLKVSVPVPISVTFVLVPKLRLLLQPPSNSVPFLGPPPLPPHMLLVFGGGGLSLVSHVRSPLPGDVGARAGCMDSAWLPGGVESGSGVGVVVGALPLSQAKAG